MRILIEVSCPKPAATLLKVDPTLMQSFGEIIAHELAVSEIGVTVADVGVSVESHAATYQVADFVFKVMGKLDVEQSGHCIRALYSAWRRMVRRLDERLNIGTSTADIVFPTGRLWGHIDADCQLSTSEQ